MDTPNQGDKSVRGADRSLLLWDLGAFGFGAALAALCALMRSPDASPAPTGAPAVWVADRDAQRVFALDGNLLLARRIHVDWPIEVEGTRDGGVWVLRSDTNAPLATHRLDRFDAQGTLVTEVDLMPCVDLDTLDDDAALVLERVDAQNVRLDRVRTEGSLFPLLAQPDLFSVCGSRASILVGTRSGNVLRVDPRTGAILAQVALGGEIGDIVPGPDPGSAWALDVQGNGRLFLLAADLTIRWAVGVGFPARHVAPVRGEERAWIPDTSSGRVRRFGPAAVVELDRANLPAVGLDRALDFGQGQVLLASPGAILRLDSSGTLLPGQGGFAWITDIAAR